MACLLYRRARRRIATLGNFPKRGTRHICNKRDLGDKRNRPEPRRPRAGGGDNARIRPPYAPERRLQHDLTPYSFLQFRDLQLPGRGVLGVYKHARVARGGRGPSVAFCAPISDKQHSRLLTRSAVHRSPASPAGPLGAVRWVPSGVRREFVRGPVQQSPRPVPGKPPSGPSPGNLRPARPAVRGPIRSPSPSGASGTGCTLNKKISD